MKQAILIFVALLLIPRLTPAATFTVVNTLDSGAGSLRQAILDANARPGADRIEFKVPGTNVHTLFPGDDLPTIADAVTIDGYTQPGASPNTLPEGINSQLRIVLNGTNAGVASGIEIIATNCTVRGLVLSSFSFYGIEIRGRSNIIEGNFVGTDPGGTSAQGNGSDGIVVFGGAGNLIGGTTPAARNLVSGNDDSGILFFNSIGNIVRGNFVGTDVTGTNSLPNSGVGVEVSGGRSNFVGGAAADARNVISGNAGAGVGLNDGSEQASFWNTVQGNFIGVDRTGTRALPNRASGVLIDGAFVNLIGGASAGARNIISGNQLAGVEIQNSSSNILQGNFIGTTTNGTGSLGNGSHGVFLATGATRTEVGGTATGAGNVIAYNAGDGVALDQILQPPAGFGNAILGNSIFANTGLGIDLGPVGVTANDAGDFDNGPNALQNYPVLDSAQTTLGVTEVNGSLNTRTGSLYRIEFFANTVADPSGFGEGERFIGFINVSTDVSGNGAFSFSPGTSVPVGQFITATATDSQGNSSEFSAAAAVRVSEWQARYDGPLNYQDLPAAIVTDEVGHVYVTGASYCGATNFDFATIKYDNTGHEVWVARYFPTNDGFDAGKAIAVDAGGNVYVTGSSEGVDTDTDFATVKYDADGNELWVARFNGPVNGYDSPRAIAVDSGGNVYVTGSSAGSGSGIDYVTVKYDSRGRQVWARRYNGPANSDDAATALVLDSAGNPVVTGWSTGTGSEVDYATLKYDRNTGNRLWLARYNGNGNASENRATALAIDGANNVVVAGSSYNPTNGLDFVTIKYRPDGSPLWEARYDGPVHRDDQAVAVALDRVGNVHVTGSSEGTGTGLDYATVKYATNGVEMWVQRYSGPGDNSDLPKALVVDSDGRVFVTGVTQGFEGGLDFGTLAYDDHGNELWRRRYDGPQTDDVATAAAVGADGSVYITGWSEGTATARDYLTLRYGPTLPAPLLRAARERRALLWSYDGVSTAGARSLRLQSEPGMRCVLQSSSNLVDWVSVQTNAAAMPLDYRISLEDGRRFFRLLAP